MSGFHNKGLDIGRLGRVAMAGGAGVCLWLFIVMVIFYGRAGRAGQEVDRTSGAYAPYDFSGLSEQLVSYLERYHDPAFKYDPQDLRGRFSYQSGKGYDLYGSTDMAYLLWTIGELDERTTLQGRREWAALIQDFQDPQSGWFNRGNETLHFKSHATAYATGALVLLGSKPLHPFTWAGRMTNSEKDMADWLGQIWWDLVWVGSHEGGGVAAALAMTGQATEEWYGWYLDWLDQEANPDTGMWQRAFYNTLLKKPNRIDLGGAAHFWWIYQVKQRPLPYPEKVIDTCLGLQLDSGLWDEKPRKGDFPYCINLDAINGINAAYFQLLASGREYRTEDIARAYDKYLRRCWEVLCARGSVEKLYTNSHDLPGALVGIAEADEFFKKTAGKSRDKTERSWRSVLEVICWL